MCNGVILITKTVKPEEVGHATSKINIIIFLPTVVLYATYEHMSPRIGIMTLSRFRSENTRSNILREPIMSSKVPRVCDPELDSPAAAVDVEASIKPYSRKPADS